jgi:2,3-bisphosphoglycerate-dependent phosphoglycerate mutase
MGYADAMLAPEKNQTDKTGKTGTLVLVRHGQSEFNAQNTFAGWVDTPLTQKGIDQAIKAGNALKDGKFKPDIVFSSKLSRAIDTGRNVLNALGMPNKEIIQLDDLIERHYGALTGKNKAQAEAELGKKKFNEYRRSYDNPPPAMDESHPCHPDNKTPGPKVVGMPKNGKGTESLEDVVARVKPIWEEKLLPELQKGKNIMIAGHGNTLRALAMIVKGMSKEEVVGYEMENAKPVMINVTSAKGSNKWKAEEIEVSKFASRGI